MVLFIFFQKVFNCLDFVDKKLTQRIRLCFLENKLLGLRARGFDKEVKSKNHAFHNFEISLSLRMLKFEQGLVLQMQNLED